MGLFNKNKTKKAAKPTVEHEPDPPLPDARTDPEPYNGSDAHLEQLEEARVNKTHNDSLSRPRKQSAFLMTLRKTGNVSRSCAAAGISRKTAYRWKANETDDDDTTEFSTRWEEVVNAYVDDLETEVDRRAFTGDDVPVVYQGELQYDTDPETGAKTLITLKRYSDALATFRLKAMRPDKYRERQEHQHTGGTENTTRVIFTMPDNGRD